MKKVKEQITELITFWECELEDIIAEGHDNSQYEDYEECEKILYALKKMNNEIAL